MEYEEYVVYSSGSLFLGGNMVIIIEGIDRIGKSTLCKKLSEKLGFPIYKEIGVEKKSREGNIRSQMSLLSLCQTTNCNVIFDRLFASEFVYGMLERNYVVIEAIKDFNDALDVLAEISDVIYVGMYSTDIKKSSKEHGKDLSEHDRLFTMTNRFVKEKLSSKQDARVIFCNYYDIDRIANVIYEIYQEGINNG